jgi:D-aminopeptidase
MASRTTLCIFVATLSTMTASHSAASPPRARELGIEIGILAPGKNNAITDVPGVEVGHATLVDGVNVHTGVTAIMPHDGNLFQDKVPAGFFVANGFGKFMGSTQVRELGEIETPILLTNTLSVPEAAAGAIEWTLRQPGNEEVSSVNAVIGETNDSFLNDIRARRVTKALVTQAIEAARGGAVEEGAIGAGTGTVAFGYKGGIGTSSRQLPKSLGGYTVGVLVQSNYGGVLTIAGAPVGKILGQYFLKDELQRKTADGSIVVIIATDAPLSDRNLERMASRAFIGVGRTGSPITNGSGDYALAFSVNAAVRRNPASRAGVAAVATLGNDQMSPLFQAVTEATEEAVVNSLFAARTTAGYQGTIPGLPVSRVVEIVRRMPATSAWRPTLSHRRRSPP